MNRSRHCHLRTTVQCKLRPLRTCMLFSIRVSPRILITIPAVLQLPTKHPGPVVTVGNHTALANAEQETVHAEPVASWDITKIIVSLPDASHPHPGHSPDHGQKAIHGRNHRRVAVLVRYMRSRISLRTNHQMASMSAPYKYTPCPQRPDRGLKLYK